MTGETVYRPLHPFQVVSDQIDGPIGSMSHDERQVFGPRPFCKWWCQEGPVDNCCCCFPLRTGMVLLSLDNLLSGVMTFYVRKSAVMVVNQLRRTYYLSCSKGGATETCKELSQRINEKEDEANFAISFLPVFYVVGFALIFFSFVGIGAAVTGNSRPAKMYMIVYPFLFVFNIAMLLLRVAVAPSTITGEFQVAYITSLFFMAHYAKVSWSFFKRRKVMEDRQLAIDASSQGHTVGMTMI
ncbi:unnamed protein product [Ascophyllum nodosum]